MGVNGSEFINNPWDTIWSPFTDMFGQGFWLIFIGFIAVALFIKTRNVAVVSVWLMGSSLLVGSAIFSNYPSMGFVYYIFTVLGLVGTIVSIFFIKE